MVDRAILAAATFLFAFLTFEGHCEELPDPKDGTRTATTQKNAFAALDWTEMLPADDTPLHRSIPPPSLRKMNDDSAETSANSGLASEMGGAPVDHTNSRRAEQFGSFKTVAALDGRRSSLSGFVVPLESDDKGDMTEFLFVPFFGACIHVPPPPPNQVVYVHLSKPMRAPELWDAYELQGTMHTHTFDADIASAAYTMNDAELIRKQARN